MHEQLIASAYRNSGYLDAWSHWSDEDKGPRDHIPQMAAVLVSQLHITGVNIDVPVDRWVPPEQAVGITCQTVFKVGHAKSRRSALNVAARFLEELARLDLALVPRSEHVELPPTSSEPWRVGAYVAGVRVAHLLGVGRYFPGPGKTQPSTYRGPSTAGPNEWREQD